MQKRGYFAVCPPLKKVVSAGVDYITVTQEHGAQAQRLWDLGITIIQQEADRGNDEKQASFQGYRGARCGQALIGTRDDGVIIQASGAAAAEHALTLLPFARNVSRLDLQVTGSLPAPDPLLARKAFKILPDLPSGNGRPVSYRLVANSQGGDTLNCGSRSSTRHGRFYDKGVESGSAKPGWLWRWELELKGRESTGAAIALVRQADAARFAADRVGSYFRRWGMAVAFSSAEQL